MSFIHNNWIIGCFLQQLLTQTILNQSTYIYESIDHSKDNWSFTFNFSDGIECSITDLAYPVPATPSNVDMKALNSKNY